MMFKDYGFLTNTPSYNKLWTVCSKLYPEASDIMLSDLANHYLESKTLPPTDKTLEELLEESEQLACSFAERTGAIKVMAEVCNDAEADSIFELE